MPHPKPLLFAVAFCRLAWAQGPAILTPIAYPGASTSAPVSINNLNQIAGEFNPGTGVVFGFLRAANGGYTQFACPNGMDTHPYAINGSGTIVGSCGVPAVCSGFIRDPNGNFTLIDFPGNTGINSYTVATGINDSGVITGYYAASNGVRHAFIRDAAGGMTSFDVPNSTDTIAVAINNSGQILGAYNNGFATAFLRAPAGAITTFNTPGPARVIDGAGRAFGITDLNSPAWVRDLSSVIRPLAIPSAHRTYLTGVNDAGVMVGIDQDTFGGFLSVPCAAAASIAPLSRPHGPGNETGTVTVTAPAGCNWTAASYADWLTHSGDAFTGSQNLSYVVLPNHTGALRAGTINVAGQIFTVSQQAGSCSYSLSGTHGVSPFGGSGVITIGTQPACGWVASADQPQLYGGVWTPLSWISISPPASGFGNGSVAYDAIRCPGCAASILAGDQSFNVTAATSPAPIYVQDDATRAVTAWYMTGTSQTATADLSGPVPGWHLAATADFDGNGVRDLVWQNDTSGLATVWFLGGADGSDLLSWTFLGDGGPAWRIVLVNDFDANGVPDLVWENQATGEHTIWHMARVNGVPQFQSWQYLGDAQPGWTPVGVGSVPSGEGGPPTRLLYWQNYATGDVTVWFGLGPFWTFVTPGVGPGWRVIGASNQDLYWQEKSTRLMTVWHLIPGPWTYNSWDFINPSTTPGAHAIFQ